MKHVLALTALAAALGGCAVVPVSDPYAPYPDGYPAYGYAPYYGYGYGPYYAYPYDPGWYGGPPFFFGGTFVFHDFHHRRHHHWDGWHRGGGGLGSRNFRDRGMGPPGGGRAR